MKVLITGANGFIGKNLSLNLAERDDVEIVTFTREQQSEKIGDLLDGVEFIVHLAGVNRPKETAEFALSNTDLTENLCSAVASVAIATGRRIPIIFSSSSHATIDSAYGASKRQAEGALLSLQRQHGVPVYIFRLPNVFGKWCKPNYNSAVATFCYNVSHDLPIKVDDPAAILTLVYVDDVVRRFIGLIDGAEDAQNDDGFEILAPQYTTTVGEVAQLIHSFKDGRRSLTTERVGTGMVRALYSTYVSYLPREAFCYQIPMYKDQRGMFAEMLKTPDCGQFSFFTAFPGVTRGGHYHHSKTEKFLVIRGLARFRFKHMHSGETYSLTTCGESAEIVETVPGWTHDITNIGNEEMIVMLWANEVFDRANPDTIVSPL